MDPLEEQAGELEALLSIYEGELRVLNDSPPPYEFSMPIKSDDFDPEDPDNGQGLFVELKFTLTPKYPEEAPVIEVDESHNVDDSCEEELMSHLREQVDENLGMVMAFTIISAAIEWLGSKWERIKEQREEDARKKKEREEEEERKKLEGTKVTIESFLSWKKAFDEERQEMRKKQKKEAAAARGTANKLTGRQLFLENSSLNESDIKFLEAAGESMQAVAVDETLFEDLDDLDLDDDLLEDDDDDEDWKPEND